MNVFSRIPLRRTCKVARHSISSTILHMNRIPLRYAFITLQGWPQNDKTDFIEILKCRFILCYVYALTKGLSMLHLNWLIYNFKTNKGLNLATFFPKVCGNVLLHGPTFDISMAMRLLFIVETGIKGNFWGPTAIHHSKTKATYKKVVSAVIANSPGLAAKGKGFITVFKTLRAVTTTIHAMTFHTKFVLVCFDLRPLK